MTLANSSPTNTRGTLPVKFGMSLAFTVRDIVNGKIYRCKGLLVVVSMVNLFLLPKQCTSFSMLTTALGAGRDSPYSLTSQTNATNPSADRFQYHSQGRKGRRSVGFVCKLNALKAGSHEKNV